MFLVKHTYSSTYFRKFLVTSPSAEMTTGYTDKMLSFHIYFIYRVKSSCFVILSTSVCEMFRVKETAIFITSAVLFSLSMSTVLLLLLIKQRVLEC
jgi:hypothetical protein